jgi:hypothetical protein
MLEAIQKLQFTDRAEAERLLLDFVQTTFPQLAVIGIELRPQAISLNSFNGFLTLSTGEKLFFKTHVEHDNVIGEYYNAAMLSEAGYRVVQPLYSSTRSGQQILIYPVITHPSVFDVARALETGAWNNTLFNQLTQAQNQSNDDLYRCYCDTLGEQAAGDALHAPVHQLFYHRLTGGRFLRFYGEEPQILLPHGIFPLPVVRNIKWHINGSEYDDTLNEVIHRAEAVLNPANEMGLTIIGHGDAHNGNVFFDEEHTRLIYFDPAFAGRHSPLLDLAKPMFHNVFAMWMYFPEQEREKLTIEAQVEGDTWIVNHNYKLNKLRWMFLESLVVRTLIPILQHIKSAGALPANWRVILKSALFCCPFLTLDLKRFPPEIALLGLTMAVQMGAESSGVRSVIDRVLDRIEAAII